MSFIFEIRLTPPQINMLMFFVKEVTTGAAKRLPKGTTASTATALVREGFLDAIKTKIGEPTKWSVTKKGFLTAQLIKEEVKTLALPRKDVDICWYDLPAKASHGIGVCGGLPDGKVVR